MDYIDKKYIILSVIGSHAGETIDEIFLRKKEELFSEDITYWLLKSFKAKTPHIQAMCHQALKEGEDVYCVFIDSSQPNGARPTIHDLIVKNISVDGNNWVSLSEHNKITGKIDSQSTALVFDTLEVIDPVEIDLWNYSEFETNYPVKMQLGASTVCCHKCPTEGMKSRFRRVVGWGKLVAPYAVYVR